MPDIHIRAGSQPTTLHRVLRGGRHVLVVPADHLASMLSDSGLRPYSGDLEIVTGDVARAPRPRDNGTGPVILVRPDGHVAGRGRPGSMEPVTGYLRDLLGNRPAIPGHAP
jgi:hypothetical protein